MFSKIFHTTKYLCAILFVFFLSGKDTIGAPYYAPTHPFPTAKQSQNACYFNSVNIAIEAKYGAKFRTKKVLDMIQFNGKSLATWEYKKKFSDLTHISLKEYSTKKDFIRLIDIGEPVLLSTEIPLKSGTYVRHVSVGYSYDDDGIWVSDPLGGKRKRIPWSEVFTSNGIVKYYNLRIVSIKPYSQWTDAWIKKELKEDIWIDEKSIR